jgi:hypothetical protein
VQCGQPGHTKQLCRMGVVRDQRDMGPPPPQPYSGQGQNQYGQGNFIGVQPGPVRQGGIKIEFHPHCGRWHVPGQCWSKGQPPSCSNCGGNHPSDECR